MHSRGLVFVWLSAGLLSACYAPPDRADVASEGPLAGGARLTSPDAALGELAQQAYIKASNTGLGDFFGRSVALSADGSTLAVGAWLERSAAAGVDGDQADNSASSAGAVYVFRRHGKKWVQQAYLKASNTDAGDHFGTSVALSGDGSTLAVGAVLEGSAATGTCGDQTDDSAVDAGAVYVFTRHGMKWSQQAYLKASNTGAGDNFGFSVALSVDGSTLAVGAMREDSAATGIDGDQHDETTSDAGAVYVFTRSGTAWSQEAYVKASNSGTSDTFGVSVALSADGSTLAVGAMGEASLATGVGGDQTDNSSGATGAVYVFTRSGTAWSQEAYVKASNSGGGDQFGYDVALSADGSTLAVGASYEDSAAAGVGGDQTDDSTVNAGAIYVFTRGAAAWSQEAYLKASNPGPDNWFGTSVALSADGSTLAVGANGEDSAATGVGGDQADTSTPASGAVYLFARSGQSWSQQEYVKASNTDASDFFGASVALSADGSYLTAGAMQEQSAATGIDGNQADDSTLYAGAVYVFHRHP